MFVYESVPGTVVTNMKSTEDQIEFNVEGWEDSSITLELEPETEYKVFVDGIDVGRMKTNLGGKLAGRRQDDCLHVGRIGVHPLNQRNTKGTGLAGAGGCLCNDAPSL